MCAACTRAARSASVICAWVVHDTAKIRPGAKSVTTVITSAKEWRDRSIEVRPFGEVYQRAKDSLSGATTASLVHRGWNGDDSSDQRPADGHSCSCRRLYGSTLFAPEIDSPARIRPDPSAVCLRAPSLPQPRSLLRAASRHQLLQPAEVAPSLLQQPAQEAQIVFDSNRLSIHADNSSLAAILHQVAASSGMKIEGLGGDERVFGTFGPGAPRDVLADLLNGTAYNLVLIGDLSNGAPRELILTPATHGAAAPARLRLKSIPMTRAMNQESQDVPPTPPPDVPQPPTTQHAPDTGVRTPQQLFEQLQRMRQGQGQGNQQQQQCQQDSPQQ